MVPHQIKKGESHMGNIEAIELAIINRSLSSELSAMTGTNDSMTQEDRDYIDSCFAEYTPEQLAELNRRLDALTKDRK